MEAEILKSRLSIKQSSEKLVAKSCRITCHKLNPIIVIKIIAIWVFKTVLKAYTWEGINQQTYEEEEGNKRKSKKWGEEG